MNRKAKVGVVVVGVCLGAVLLVAMWNNVALQRPLSEVANNDERNAGIECSAHFGDYVRPEILVFDLESVRGDKSPADVFRLFLQYAEAMSGERFERVELTYRGETRFFILGDYFQKIGLEYSTQNPVYTMRTFPENLWRADGTQAFSSWTGGLLGVTSKQMEDFGAFHKEWYISSLDI